MGWEKNGVGEKVGRWERRWGRGVGRRRRWGGGRGCLHFTGDSVNVSNSTDDTISFISDDAINDFHLISRW